MSSQLPSPPDALIESVRQHAAAAEAAFQSGDPARLVEGLNACGLALTEIQSAVVKTGPEETAVLPASLGEIAKHVWFQRGNMLDALATIKNDPQLVVEALRSYDQVIGLGRQQPSDVGLLAVAWISRGKGLQRLGSPEAITEALRCYDETIALIGEPVESIPVEIRNTLGAALMSRAGILQHNPDPSARAARVEAMEKAVACLKTCVGHIMSQRNLASAWTNLGLMRQEMGDTAGAVVAQEEAMAVIETLFAQGPEVFRIERATILMNLGQSRCAAHDTEAGLNNLREAITSVNDRATSEPNAADTVLRARHAIGVTLGAKIAAAAPGDPARPAWMEEAGDAVEEGLALLKTWGERATWFSQIGTRLYEFGAWFYRTQQPHFLAEFLLEHLGEDKQREKIAAGAVQAARHAVTQRSFSAASHDNMGRALELLQGLGEVETLLKSRGVAL